MKWPRWMMVSKMDCGMIVRSLQVVCIVTGDSNKRLILKVKLALAESCQLQSLLTFSRENMIFARLGKSQLEESIWLLRIPDRILSKSL